MTDEHRDELDPALARSVELLRTEIPVRADWRAALLARVEAERTGRSGWRLNPSMAIAAGLVLFVTGAAIGRFSQPSSTALTASAPAVANVRFVYVAPAARKVFIVGDFNQWNPDAMPLKRLADGTWIGDVPLGPGRYAYAFVVDGKIEVDPAAPKAAGEFGENSIVMVRGS